MGSFQDKWSAPQKQSFVDKLGDTFKPKGSLKPRVEMAVKRLQAQIGKLDGMCSKTPRKRPENFPKNRSCSTSNTTPIQVKYYQMN